MTCIHSCYAQLVLSGTLPPCSDTAQLLLSLHEALSSSLASAGLTISNVLSCTLYCRSSELEGTLLSLLTELLIDVELSPLLPADTDFIVHVHCLFCK